MWSQGYNFRSIWKLYPKGRIQFRLEDKIISQSLTGLSRVWVPRESWVTSLPYSLYLIIGAVGSVGHGGLIVVFFEIGNSNWVLSTDFGIALAIYRQSKLWLLPATGKRWHPASGKRGKKQFKNRVEPGTESTGESRHSNFVLQGNQYIFYMTLFFIPQYQIIIISTYSVRVYGYNFKW